MAEKIEKKERGAKSKPASAYKNYKITKLYLNNYSLELIQLVGRVPTLSCYETMKSISYLELNENGKESTKKMHRHHVLPIHPWYVCAT